jgi:hypothetical protein
MTPKADFNAEEWSTVVHGPLYAGMRVISADRGGTLRESLAMGRVYQGARVHHGESELLDELDETDEARWWHAYSHVFVRTWAACTVAPKASPPNNWRC